MAKVTIKRRNGKCRADGEAPLYAVLHIAREKIRIPLRISVSDREWDAPAERVIGRSQESKDKNLIISNIKAKISDILVRYRLTGEKITKESFLALLRSPGETMNFIEYARRRLNELCKALQPQTIRRHESVLKKIEQYNPDLHISDITPEWLQIYAAHLRDYYHNNSGTIGKNMSVIRMHYFAALREGKVRSNPFEVYRLPTSEPEVVFLTEPELNLLTELYNSDRLDEKEQNVLRFFLFMTFTAMHISDARALQINQIINNELIYRRIKTGVKVRIPLSDPAIQLVEYYKGGRNRGRLFLNLPSDQSINRIIKIICGRVGITKPVSAKTGRHTFATLYYKLNSGDLGTLSKLLGHTSVNTTMIYAHIMKENREAGVAAFNGFKVK